MDWKKMEYNLPKRRCIDRGTLLYAPVQVWRRNMETFQANQSLYRPVDPPEIWQTLICYQNCFHQLYQRSHFTTHIWGVIIFFDIRFWLLSVLFKFPQQLLLVFEPIVNVSQKDALNDDYWARIVRISHKSIKHIFESMWPTSSGPSCARILGNTVGAAVIVMTFCDFPKFPAKNVRINAHSSGTNCFRVNSLRFCVLSYSAKIQSLFCLIRNSRIIYIVYAMIINWWLIMKYFSIGTKTLTYGVTIFAVFSKSTS